MGECPHKKPVTFIWESVLLIKLSVSTGRLVLVMISFLIFLWILVIANKLLISWILLDQSQLVPFTVAPNAPFSCKLFVPSPRPRTIFLPIYHCYVFSRRNLAQGHLPAQFTLLIKLTYSQDFLKKIQVYDKFLATYRSVWKARMVKLQVVLCAFHLYWCCGIETSLILGYFHFSALDISELCM